MVEIKYLFAFFKGYLKGYLTIKLFFKAIEMIIFSIFCFSMIFISMKNGIPRSIKASKYRAKVRDHYEAQLNTDISSTKVYSTLKDIKVIINNIRTEGVYTYVDLTIDTKDFNVDISDIEELINQKNELAGVSFHGLSNDIDFKEKSFLSSIVVNNGYSRSVHSDSLEYFTTNTKEIDKPAYLLAEPRNMPGRPNYPAQRNGIFYNDTRNLTLKFDKTKFSLIRVDFNYSYYLITDSDYIYIVL